MKKIELKYGRTSIPFEFDANRFGILAADAKTTALSDIEIGEKLDNPIDSERLEEIVSPGDSVLLVVPDATRETACGQMVNLLVRRLIANGTAVSDIGIIFPTGIHRRVTEAEKQQILTPFIAQRVKTLHHEAGNPLKIFRVGNTSGGIPVELNWTLTEFEHVVSDWRRDVSLFRRIYWRPEIDLSRPCFVENNLRDAQSCLRLQHTVAS